MRRAVLLDHVDVPADYDAGADALGNALVLKPKPIFGDVARAAKVEVVLALCEVDDVLKGGVAGVAAFVDRAGDAEQRSFAVLFAGGEEEDPVADDGAAEAAAPLRLLELGDGGVGRLHFGADVVELTCEPLGGLKDGVMARLVLSLDELGQQRVYDRGGQVRVGACEADVDEVTGCIAVDLESAAESRQRCTCCWGQVFPVSIRSRGYALRQAAIYQ